MSRLDLADNADLIVCHADDLIAPNLARLPCFDDAIDADITRRDHRLGNAPRGRKREQFEENVQLDEVIVELEGVPGHRTSDYVCATGRFRSSE